MPKCQFVFNNRYYGSLCNNRNYCKFFPFCLYSMGSIKELYDEELTNKPQGVQGEERPGREGLGLGLGLWQLSII